MRSFKQKCDNDFVVAKDSLRNLCVSFDLLNTNITKNLDLLYTNYDEVYSTNKYRALSDFLFGYNEYITRCRHQLEKDFEIVLRTIYDDLIKSQNQSMNNCNSSTNTATTATTSDSNKTSTNVSEIMLSAVPATVKKKKSKKYTSSLRSKLDQSILEQSSIILDLNSEIFDSVLTGIFKQKNDLALNVYYDVVVTHIESPTLFWIQFKQTQEKLNSLCDDLNDFYGQEITKNLSIETPEINSLCAARFSADRSWYRAKIMHIYPIDNSIHVFYVDFGNDEMLSATQIRKLDDRFCDLEFLACPMSLMNAYPVQDSEDKTWPKHVIDIFSDLIYDCELKIKIYNDKTWPLSFCWLVKEDKDILQTLIEINLAKHVSNSAVALTFSEQVIKVLQNKIDNNTKILDLNNNLILVNDVFVNEPIEEPQIKSFIVDEVKSCEFENNIPKAQSVSFITATAPAIVTTSTIDSASQPVLPIIEQTPTPIIDPAPKRLKLPIRLIKLDEKHKFDCTISHVIDPFDFYVCLRKENFELYDKMEIDLNQFYQKNKDTYRMADIDKSKIETENIYCAIYSHENNTFCRGLVKDKLRIDDHLFQYTVYVFDYGPFEIVDCENMFRLHEDFYKLPPLQFRCSLDSIQPVLMAVSTNGNANVNWSKEAKDFFYSMAMKKCTKFQCLVVRPFGKPNEIKCKIETNVKVVLRGCTNNGSYITLNDELIRCEYAKSSIRTIENDTNSIVSSSINSIRKN